MDKHLSRPSSLFFIICTIFLGLLLNIFPWGNHSWVPDWLLIVLVFWNVYDPRKISMFTALLLGLLMDVHFSSLLGLHAISYSLVTFITIAWHRRILDLTTIPQAFHLLPIFFIGNAFNFLVFWWIQDNSAISGWSFFISCIIEACLWPLAKWLLSTPQRRQNASLPL
jgi:rod shape-determining protein MreD